MRNIGNRLKKIENKVMPKIQTIIFKINKGTLSEDNISILRTQGKVEEKDDYILVKYVLARTR